MTELTLTNPGPPRVDLPKPLQGMAFAFFRDVAMRRWIERYGPAFEIDVPFFGRSVVVSDPALVKTVCRAGVDDLVNVQPNLSNWFGPGSVFALDGPIHRSRHRLLVPAFHGGSLRDGELMIAEETVRELVNWPEKQEFRILEPMNRITLNVILRVLFGSAAGELATLRAMVPPYLRLGSVLAFAPRPPLIRGTPWARLDGYRRLFDDVVVELIQKAQGDAHLDERTDVLAVLVRDGGIPHQHIADELLTLIGAGHETTAAALAWTFERLRRHPDVLTRLVDEMGNGGNTFRRATIMEVLRTRAVIDVAGRRVSAPTFDLGDWRIPRGRTVLVRIADLHRNPEIYIRPELFDPERFLGARPAAGTWLPFGGGARRCVGADFAMIEMDIVLRTVLQRLRLHTDSASDERSYFRGVTHTPKHGARVTMSRRS